MTVDLEVTVEQRAALVDLLRRHRRGEEVQDIPQRPFLLRLAERLANPDALLAPDPRRPVVRLRMEGPVGVSASSLSAAIELLRIRTRGGGKRRER